MVNDPSANRFGGSSAPESAAPAVSVIIPHYNDLANLGACLRLLAAQTLPALTTPASTPHVAMTMSAPVSASARRRRTMPSPCLLPGISSAKNTGRRRKRTDREVAVAQTRLAYHYQHA